MSLNISPVKAASAVASSIVSPKAPPKLPYVLDESVPHPKNPTRRIVTNIFDKIVNNIKNKPDSERNMFDYAILLADKLMKLNPKVYAS